MIAKNFQNKCDISFNSFNCRGLRCKSKRLSIFHWLNTTHKGITLLQETHSDTTIENQWEKEFGGLIYFSHGTTYSKGVALLIPNNIKSLIKIVEIKKDNSGRLLIVHCEIAETELVIFNIYAPTKDFPHEQNTCLNIRKFVEEYGDRNLLIGGDFNICLNFKMDKNGGKIEVSSSYQTNLTQLMEEYSLTDIWRLRNPDCLQYTRHERCRGGFVQSRLDYFLISKSLEYDISHCYIKPGLQSDHSLIRLDMNLKGTVIRGKGTWKFNNNLPKDKEYVALIKNTIQKVKYNVFFSNKNTLWEYLKCQIRTDTISYSILKQKRLKKEQAEVTTELSNLEKNLDIYNEDEILEYSLLKRKWENIQNLKTQGAILRSKAKFVEEGEKNSKYFLNLEKRNYKERYMKSVMNSQDLMITDPSEILNEQAKFYENLYTSSGINRSQDNLFFDNCDIPQLSNEKKTLLDNPLTLAEISEALKDMSNDKSPGLDGFTTNFYKFFWIDIRSFLYDSYNYSIQHGELSDSQRRGLLSLIPKNGKDLRYLKSWRPVTLLATDYKILAKALATRLQGVKAVTDQERQWTTRHGKRRHDRTFPYTPNTTENCLHIYY